MLEETVAFGIVIGCSIFGMLWGLVNTILVRYTPPAFIVLTHFSIDTWSRHGRSLSPSGSFP